MTYKKSVHRSDFDDRIKNLLENCRKANLQGVESGIRDMVFQCAILHTSAAMETYLRLIIESYVQAARSHNVLECLPTFMKAFVISKRVEHHFANFAFHKEELKLLTAVVGETSTFGILTQNCFDWTSFQAAAIHSETTYPSMKNIKRLFVRLGLTDFTKKANQNLKGDFETLITNFQSLRTALAHGAPPQITLNDARDRLRDMQRAVSVLDRILYTHVINFGGRVCWK